MTYTLFLFLYIIEMGKPTPEALQFLAQCVVKISEFESGYVQGDFYAELLRALTLEGDPWLAKKLISKENKVRTRTDEKVKVTDAIELVEKVYTQLNFNNNFSSPVSVGSSPVS